MCIKKKTVFISQSMYFPWCSLLDKIRLADIFIHYDDVKLSRGFYNRVHYQNYDWLHELPRALIKALAKYFQLDHEIKYIGSIEHGVLGSRSKRLMNLTQAVGGKTYLIGRGALKHLDNNLFEQNDIEVRYMDYCIAEYAQAHVPFSPNFTTLDAIAYLGVNARNTLTSVSKYWRETDE